MSDNQSEDDSEAGLPTFRPFTREELALIENRILEKEMAAKRRAERLAKNIAEYGDSKRAQALWDVDSDDEEEDILEPNPKLSQGNDLPRRYGEFPLEMASTPIVDIDPYYADKRTFIVINKGGAISRFSATKAMWILSPFHPIRRIALTVFTHPMFGFAIITTILVNCKVMTMPESEYSASTDTIFTAIYTYEASIKILSRGFCLDDHTFLRDSWNWLDISVIALSYVTIAIDLGQLSALKTFRVFRALKSVAVVPGLKTIVGAIVYSVKNLRDVIILTVFMLAIFALMGLQLYMGVLGQKCVRQYPTDPDELKIWGNISDETYDYFMHNESNWWVDVDGNYGLCGNSSGAGKCPDGFSCMQGYGPNPNYGYTSFDHFFAAYLTAFRIMTQDFWENLYQITLQTAGPLHILFFLVNILFGSFYLVNLILAIVAMSYDTLQREAEEEAARELEELEAIKEAEEAALAEAEAAAAEAAAAATEGLFDDDFELDDDDNGSVATEARSTGGRGGSSIGVAPPSSLPDGSSQYINHTPDKDSLDRSEDSLDKSGNGSPPMIRRRPSQIQNGKKPLVLFNYLDAQNHLPYADDSTQGTPKSERNGGIIIDNPIRSELGRKYSMNGKDGSQLSSNSDIWYPGGKKNGHLISTISNQYEMNQKPSPFHDGGKQEMNTMNMKDVMVLNEIIDQVAARPPSQHSDDSELYQDDDDEGPTIKDILVECGKRACDILCICDCCWLWIRCAEILSYLVFDPFCELFITLSTIVNIAFMAMDSYDMEYDGMSPTKSAVLFYGNYFFTAVFAAESTVKLFAMGPRYFFADAWNNFDFVIVIFSMIELLFEGISGLSMLRSLRLLRVFKLAKSWKSLNDILTIMGNTVGALSNLTFVLVIIIFIFAVMGMQLYGNDYRTNVCYWDGCEMPRWNFTDFFHSFMVVFRVLCGEWIESMWDCMFVAGSSCIPYFFATVLIGNLVILNLFLALLLSSFSDMGAEAEDDEPDKMAIAFGRFGRLKRWIIESIKSLFRAIGRGLLCLVTCGLKGRKAQPVTTHSGENGTTMSRELTGNSIDLEKGGLGGTTRSYTDTKIGEGMDISIQGQNGSILQSKDSWKTANSGLMPEMGSSRVLSGSMPEFSRESVNEEGSVHSGDSGWRRSKKREASPQHEKKQEEDALSYMEEVEHVDEVMYDPVDEIVVEDCCPPGYYRLCPCCSGDGDSPLWHEWHKHRLQISRLIEDKYFETVVLALILLSSFVMTLEDVWFETKPLLVDTLYYLDRILTVVFFLETCLKLLAMGFVAYFGNAWCWLDFVIVGVSLINFAASLLGAGNIPIFKTMRTLRALRPLRAMAKMEGMKVVVNALVGALPSIFNVLLVCLIFWLIFAIIGVNLFMGKFQECIDTETGERFDKEVVPNKSVCLTFEKGLWTQALITYDNSPLAYLCLFQIATFKGWQDIMDDAVDMPDNLNDQPSFENSLYFYIYFVAFIVFGSFFTLNLLVGVIIDKFNEQKNKGGSSLDTFMTEDQRKYIAAMKKAGNKKPTKALPRPTWAPQAIVFGIITNKKFDMIIMGFIMLNMIAMMCDHFNMSNAWKFALDNANLGFIVIFTAEMCMKMFALRHYYFTDGWCIFDFVVVCLSLVSLFFADLIEKYFPSPTLLRVVRVAKVGRVLRLIKGAKGIRTLLFSLVMSLPALMNICLLLFLVMFIFAVFGISLFKHTKIRPGFNDVHNFKTFFKTFILLFQMATSAGWDGTLTAIFDFTDCKEADPEIGENGDCGNFGAGIAYLIAYLVMSFLVIVNMYIAVILENYSQASEDVSDGITDEDYDLFYEIWQEFDPDGTMYIDYKNLSEFLDVLDPPLQVPRPNKFKIIHMDIPIVRWTDPKSGEAYEDKVYCSDILDAITKDFFARKGGAMDETTHVTDIQVATFADRPGYERTSSSLWKQREEYCAALIQKAWKDHQDVRRKVQKSKSKQSLSKKANNGKQIKVKSA